MITSGHVKFHPDLASLLEPIENVRPHPDNPNSGDQEAVATSIEINGMYRPVYAQRSTSFIVAGNTTYAACLSLDADQIPVVWLDVDDEAALRILLGDNQIARLAIIDQALLEPQLQRLLQTELRLLGTGYPDLLPEVNVPLPQPLEPIYTVTVSLHGDRLHDWFDLPGDNDRDRLFFLLDGVTGRVEA